MSDSLKSSIGNFIIDIDNDVTVDYDKLPKKVTFLFVSSSYAATMKNKSEQLKDIFILEEDKNKVDHCNRFENGKDLIFELADDIYRCLKKNPVNIWHRGIR
jgi:hypothetical protein